ncbi:unnamed protein product, partial [Scytosiphon promiscuus]
CVSADVTALHHSGWPCDFSGAVCFFQRFRHGVKFFVLVYWWNFLR